MQERVTNEARLVDKIYHFMLGQPISKAKPEESDLKRKKLEQAEEEKTEGRKNLEADIDIKGVVGRVTTRRFSE